MDEERVFWGEQAGEKQQQEEKQQRQEEHRSFASDAHLAAALVADREEVVERAVVDAAPLSGAPAAAHRVRLARAGLAVGKDADVVACGW